MTSSTENLPVNLALSATPDPGALRYLLGVDGGGSGTRVVLADLQGRELARAAAGPSGLALGRAAAWRAIEAAIAAAFQAAGLVQPHAAALALACGLAGVNNVQWAAELMAQNPGYGLVVAETDAYTSLLGAHAGQAGVVVALGTGSVAQVLHADGSRREVGGWGFPVGDEASGAWLGMRAMNFLQRVLDGRAAANTFSLALLAQCGGDKDGVFAWLAQAKQTRFASLAPLVIEHAATQDVARDMLLEAGRDVELMVAALDPTQSLPVAVCGGLAAAISPFLPPALQQRLQPAKGDSASGALILIRDHIDQSNRKD
ncbi:MULTISPECIES: BadF/BadG/BcrA/BcrD ATPase family protein [unclassified Undibacterium]|uniref:BadF/BadG/BcrA/BcrD ATPase family protein n=1 Tax=unclassified Undibacterium TaxID=2630295 RepID=UPI002AC9942C|nr:MULTISPECIES: BadF/BadG/BcrA/BcrD ATPase family protein [unclassified Undibacterium]MEB0213748.1 BadF/BadG/BcrA/BcrD ATPase family protein [Undibacterium sp. 5I2]WPX43912.1 BadF/BadG/BcrA/BcrD ATPase family protein [Undibacterium sp. CCC3.4]